MNGVMMMCEIMASWVIVGAVESSPGWITIDYLNRRDEADFIVIPKEIYSECTGLEAGVSRL